MTETFQDRLRYGAKNIHSIGPDRAAALLGEAAEAAARYDVDAGMARLLGQQLDEIAALLGPVEPSDAARDTSWKAPDPVDLVRGIVADLALTRRTAAMWRRRCERYEAWWALPQDQRHPGGPEFSGPLPGLAGAGELASATGSEIYQDAVAAHIKAHGGDPEVATVAQIADAMNATDPNFTYRPNAAGDGLDATPVQPVGAGGSISIVSTAPGVAESLGLQAPAPHHKAAEFQKLIDDLRGKHVGVPNSPEARAQIQTELAGFIAALDAPPPPNIILDDEASDLANGKIAFKVRVSPELAAAIERQREEDAERAAKARQVHTLGSPVITIAPGIGDPPAEPLTPEQETEQEERLERFDHDWD